VIPPAALRHHCLSHFAMKNYDSVNNHETANPKKNLLNFDESEPSCFELLIKKFDSFRSSFIQQIQIQKNSASFTNPDSDSMST
jgi:hypothetical protein